MSKIPPYPAPDTLLFRVSFASSSASSLLILEQEPEWIYHTLRPIASAALGALQNIFNASVPLFPLNAGKGDICTGSARKALPSILCGLWPNSRQLLRWFYPCGHTDIHRHPVPSGQYIPAPGMVFYSPLPQSLRISGRSKFCSHQLPPLFLVQMNDAVCCFSGRYKTGNRSNARLMRKRTFSPLIGLTRTVLHPAQFPPRISVNSWSPTMQSCSHGILSAWAQSADIPFKGFCPVRDIVKPQKFCKRLTAPACCWKAQSLRSLPCGFVPTTRLLPHRDWIVVGGQRIIDVQNQSL